MTTTVETIPTNFGEQYALADALPEGTRSVILCEQRGQITPLQLLLPGQVYVKNLDPKKEYCVLPVTEAFLWITGERAGKTHPPDHESPTEEWKANYRHADEQLVKARRVIQALDAMCDSAAVSHVRNRKVGPVEVRVEDILDILKDAP